MLAAAVAIFAGVLAAALYALRPGRRPAPVSGRAMLVGGGLVFPAVVLGSLLVAALLVGDRLAPRARVPEIGAVAEQWGWRFTYPGAAGSTRALHVPAGEPFQVRVTSRDVIHSFWVPRLGGKIDAVPGQANRIRLQADRPGVYLGQCAEYCGVGHAGMGFQVVAHPPQAYAARLAEALAREDGR